MEQKKPTEKPKAKLSLTVKTLEKKSAPARAEVCGASPVIGYS
jgi:hypothetical protein